MPTDSDTQLRTRGPGPLVVGLLVLAATVGLGAVTVADDDPAERPADAAATSNDLSADAAAAVADAATAAGAEEASVTFVEQRSNGTVVTVSRAHLPEGGFLVVHNEDGEVIGHSAYLEEGTHENVTVRLDEQLQEGRATLVAMAHRDTNGNQEYDFGTTDSGEDGPYTADGDPVTDSACIEVSPDCPPVVTGEVSEQEEQEEEEEEQATETTPTPTETETPTSTESPPPTETAAPTLTETATSTPPPTPTLTPTETETPTSTESPTPTEMAAPTPTLSPTPTSTPTETETATPTDVGAISFVAFCLDGGAEGTATIDEVYTDEEGEPYAIEWSSDVEIATVVVGYGQNNGVTLENHDGGTRGTAVAGTGEAAGENQSPDSPCPDGETLLVKYNWNGSSFQEDETADGSGSKGKGDGADGIGQSKNAGNAQSDPGNRSATRSRNAGIGAVGLAVALGAALRRLRG